MPVPRPPPLVLASTSLHRRMLLERLGLPFQARSPQVDEALRAGEAPADRSLRLAIEKARAVAALIPDALVIGSDQVASLATAGQVEILRKPGTRERCLEQLARMSAHTAHFYTSVAISGPRGIQTHSDLTQVRFRQLSAEDIAAYVEREPAFDCAGGFKCEGLGVCLFESVATDDPTALVGLPLIGLCRLLRGAGVRI